MRQQCLLRMATGDIPYTRIIGRCLTRTAALQRMSIFFPGNLPQVMPRRPLQITLEGAMALMVDGGQVMGLAKI